MSQRIVVAVCVLLGVACSDSTGSRPDGGNVATGPATLVAEPPGMGFDCIAPGCNQVGTVRLVSQGPGTARILAINLDLSSSSDYALSPGMLPPFDLAPGEGSDVSVEYSPTDAAGDDGTLVIEYGSVGSTERKQLRVPLLSRSIGIPKVEIDPRLITFGYVPQGERVSSDIRVRNVGTGNALLEVPATAFSRGVDYEVSPDIPPPLVVGPGQERKITVTYAPTNEGVHFDTLNIKTTDVTQPNVEVFLRGTSVSGASGSLVDAGPIVFGDVRVGGSANHVLEISSNGGQALEITGYAITGAGAGQLLVSPPASAIGPVAPFAAASLTITYAPTSTGVHDATLTITTNDPNNPTFDVEIQARGVDPRLTVTPTLVNYGQVVVGWERGPTAVTARNEGFGPIEVQRVFLAPGSSAQFSLGTLPGLPIVLNQGNRFDFEIRYEATITGAATATLVIESNDPNNSRVEVQLRATGVTCAQGCPLAHATARCDHGFCEIASCDSGYYDTDARDNTGCECKIESPEPSPSGLCGEARWLGSLNDDNGDSVTVVGQLHRPQDVDWFNVFGEDSGGINELFGDDFHIRVTFTAPSGYRMCVFRAKRDSHEDICPANADSACTPVTSYSDDGSYGSSDSADYFIKIYTTGSQTTCGTYTLTIKNG